MKPPMLHTAQVITHTRNAYGDYVATASTTIKCHFRFINEMITTGYNEAVQSDAMAWFEPDSGIVRESLVRIDGDYYRVEKVIKARKLRNPNVQFIKAYLAHYGVIS
jgi:hypothetical protein